MQVQKMISNVYIAYGNAITLVSAHNEMNERENSLLFSLFEAHLWAKSHVLTKYFNIRTPTVYFMTNL